MAKSEYTLRGNFDDIMGKLEKGILKGSLSASLEDETHWRDQTAARCSVLVFERYSVSGGNRLSLTLTLFSTDAETVRVSAITAGGSQATFFKWNTMGEESFLHALDDLVARL